MTREYSVRVNQAAGIVAEQTGCTGPEAIKWIEDRAAATSQTVDQAADAIIEDTLRLDE